RDIDLDDDGAGELAAGENRSRKEQGGSERAAAYRVLLSPLAALRGQEVLPVGKAGSHERFRLFEVARGDADAVSVHEPDRGELELARRPGEATACRGRFRIGSVGDGAAHGVFVGQQ